MAFFCLGKLFNYDCNIQKKEFNFTWPFTKNGFFY